MGMPAKYERARVIQGREVVRTGPAPSPAGFQGADRRKAWMHLNSSMENRYCRKRKT